MRLAIAGQNREATEFVARPLADRRRGDVADIVVVEAQQSAERRIADSLAGASQAISVQTPEIDALLEIDIHDPMSIQARPVVVRIDILGLDLETLGHRRPGRFAARGLAVFLLLAAHESLRIRSFDARARPAFTRSNPLMVKQTFA